MAGIVVVFVILGAIGGCVMAGPIGLVGGAVVGLIIGGAFAAIASFLRG